MSSVTAERKKVPDLMFTIFRDTTTNLEKETPEAKE